MSYVNVKITKLHPFTKQNVALYDKAVIDRVSRRIKKWVLPVGFSVADQLVLSAANFFFNVLLVRSLTANQYGAFTIAFSAFLFLSGLQNALVLQPASVIGATYYQNSMSRYFNVTVFINGILSCCFAVLLLICAVVALFFNYYLAISFFGLAIATPFVLFFWLFRQICYIETRSDLAWRASFLYAFFLMASFFTLKGIGHLSVFTAFLIMAFCSLFAALFFWRYLNVEPIGAEQDAALVRKILLENWRYGRWVMGSAVTNWVSTLSYVPLVGLLIGTKDAGAFRAIQNLMLPLERVLSVFSLLLIPWISRNRATKGHKYVKKRVFTLLIVNLILASLYACLLTLYGIPIAKLLYSTSYAVSFTWLIPYFAVCGIASALVQVLGTGLKILERPNFIFISEAIASIVTLTAGLYLIFHFKIQGSVVGLILSTVTMLLSMLFFLSNYLKRKEKI